MSNDSIYTLFHSVIFDILTSDIYHNLFIVIKDKIMTNINYKKKNEFNSA